MKDKPYYNMHNDDKPLRKHTGDFLKDKITRKIQNLMSLKYKVKFQFHIIKPTKIHFIKRSS